MVSVSSGLLILLVCCWPLGLPNPCLPMFPTKVIPTGTLKCKFPLPRSLLFCHIPSHERHRPEKELHVGPRGWIFKCSPDYSSPLPPFYPQNCLLIDQLCCFSFKDHLPCLPLLINDVRCSSKTNKANIIILISLDRCLSLHKVNFNWFRMTSTQRSAPERRYFNFGKPPKCERL